MTTPEMFAEYRDTKPDRPANLSHQRPPRFHPCEGCGTHHSDMTGCPQGDALVNMLDRPANLSQPGPAWISAGTLAYRTTDPDYFRRAYNVPVGYVWQPATEWTGAGWARPKGGAIS